MKKPTRVCPLQDQHIAKMVEKARKNWKDWSEVFEHDCPINENPVLSDKARFASFCAEYSVHRTIRKGRQNQFREALIRSSTFSKAIQDDTGHSLDRLERHLRPKFGSNEGKNRLTSVLSKVAAFVRPERFVAWDRFARAGLNTVLCRSPSSAFKTYSNYLSDFDSVWNGQQGKQIRDYGAKHAYAEVEGEDRFLRRVLDMYLMECGGRWNRKRGRSKS